MSGHRTEEVMELSLDVDSDDHVLPSDPADYDYNYDYQEVLGIPARVQGNFTDRCSDSGNSSDGNSDDDFTCKNNILPKISLTSPWRLSPVLQSMMKTFIMTGHY